MAEEYEGMTVAELKALLKERGLPVSGKKSELIDRLSDNQEEEIVDTEEIESPAADESSADEDFGIMQTKIGTMTGKTTKMKVT